MCELQRIASHLVWIGTHALDVGAMSVFFYAFDEREKILNMFEDVCGGRMTPSYFRVGGMYQDLPAGFDAKVKKFLEEFPATLEAFDTLLTGHLRAHLEQGVKLALSEQKAGVEPQTKALANQVIAGRGRLLGDLSRD